MATNFPNGVSSHGAPVEGLATGVNIFGNHWFVDGTNGSDTSYDGKSPSAAFATLYQASSVSAAGDTIWIAPGTYTQTAAQEPLTPTANQTWRAAVYNPADPTVIITGTAEAIVVDVEVAGVTFIGIEFVADHNDVSQLVMVADTAAVAGLTFVGCVFNGNGKTTVDGIQAADATYALTGLYCTKCTFNNCDVGIEIGALGFADSIVEDNRFYLIDTGGADTGISLGDTGAGATGYGFLIRNNDFIGPTDAGADAVGITIAGTENTTAIGSIRSNYFANCNAAAITIDKISKSEVNNYVGDAATGGTLVDPGT